MAVGCFPPPVCTIYYYTLREFPIRRCARIGLRPPASPRAGYRCRPNLFLCAPDKFFRASP